MPEPLVSLLTIALKYDALNTKRSPGRDLLRGFLNFFIILAVPLLLLMLFSPASAIVVLLILVVCFVLLVLIYPRFHARRSTSIELKTSLFTMDIFSTVYFLTGSVELAASYLAGKDSEISRSFRNVLLKIRNGTEPRRALLASFPTGIHHEWLTSVAYGSLTDTRVMLDAWRVQALKTLSRAEDVTAFIILLSSLLPVVSAMVFLICGEGSTPMMFLLVILEVAEFLGVYLWLKDLVSPLD